MLILLPPSETKREGGVDGSRLSLRELGFPALTAPRREALAALEELARDPEASATALKLGPTQAHEAERNRRVRRSPVLPSLDRYDGVLYDALDAASLPEAARAFAHDHLAIASALFGLTRALDPIPAYRLSGGSRVPGIGPLTGYWREAVTGEVAGHRGLVVDMLSAPYASMVALPRRAVTVKVWRDAPGGRRTAVSHFNKATKGELARLLATSPVAARMPGDVLEEVRADGWRAELDGARLDVWMRE